jgi:methyl-accepting chemotaxis protein
MGAGLDDRQSRHQLRLTTRATLATLAGIGLVLAVTAQLIRLGGPTYERLRLGNELVADILPPPQYLVESQLLVGGLALDPGGASREDDIAKLTQLHADYDTRHAYWLENLDDPTQHRLLLVEAHRAADEYFRVTESEFVPAVRAGDRATAQRLATGRLRQLYDDDRAAVDQLVPLGNAEVTAAVSDSERNVVLGVLAALGSAAALVVMIRRLGTRAVDALDASARQAADLEAVLADVRAEAESLTGRAAALDGIAESMTAGAQDTAGQAAVASAAAEQVAATATEIAGAADQLEAAIAAVARGAEQAAATTRQAVAIANGTREAVTRLGTSSVEISAVIDAIGSITADTNILALNAGIEAARAGDAGKGFGVVANEVKDLAGQTARATDDIRRRIGRIQDDTAESVAAIDQVTGVVEQISTSQDDIVAAVVEQTTSARTMAARAAEVAHAAQAISASIVHVARAADETTRGAAATQQAAGAVSASAGQLEQVADVAR